MTPLARKSLIMWLNKLKFCIAEFKLNYRTLNRTERIRTIQHYGSLLIVINRMITGKSRIVGAELKFLPKPK